MTRIDNESLDHVREQGFVVVEGFLDSDALAAAQAGFHLATSTGTNRQSMMSGRGGRRSA